jgi:pilus assembly protein CpaD
MTQMATRSEARDARRSRLLQALAIGLVSLSVAACSHSASQVAITGAVSTDYRDNYPITISDQLATLDVPVGLQTRYLPAGMEDNILGFAAAFMQSGSNAFAIVLPAGSANAPATAAIALQIEELVITQAGIPPGAIEYRSYPAQPDENAPVRLAYVRLAATTPPCGNWPTNLARNWNNQNYANFGCATQNNLAAMVANPLDLLYPRMMTPPDAARRSAVLGNYEDGQATATTYEGGFGIDITGIGQ